MRYKVWKHHPSAAFPGRISDGDRHHVLTRSTFDEALQFVNEHPAEEGHEWRITDENGAQVWPNMTQGAQPTNTSLLADVEAGRYGNLHRTEPLGALMGADTVMVTRQPEPGVVWVVFRDDRDEVYGIVMMSDGPLMCMLTRKASPYRYAKMIEITPRVDPDQMHTEELIRALRERGYVVTAKTEEEVEQ